MLPSALPPFILASKSPRRKELLSSAGFQFEIRTKEVDESFPEDMPGAEVPVYLAKKKAEAFDLAQGEILVTGDTVVCKESLILNKPADAAEAKEMLETLSGSKHEVITGVCIRKDNLFHTFSEVTEVEFAELSDEIIDFYIESFKPYDKAGAYGIQEWIGLVAINGIKGCYQNVVGFPVARFFKEFQMIS